MQIGPSRPPVTLAIAAATPGAPHRPAPAPASAPEAQALKALTASYSPGFLEKVRVAGPPNLRLVDIKV